MKLTTLKNKIEKINSIIAETPDGIEPDSTWESVYRFYELLTDGKKVFIKYDEIYTGKSEIESYRLDDEDLSWNLNWVVRCIKKYNRENQ